MRKKLAAFIALVAVVLAPCIASAASRGYVSYLVLPTNVQVEGSTRNYSYPNHKVLISVDSIYDPYNPNYVVISLNKKNLIGSTQQARKTSSYSVGSDVTTIMGNYGSGKKWYGFGSYQYALYNGNYGHGTIYSGINSDNVVMTSYD